jgi:hypothetical protein
MYTKNRFLIPLAFLLASLLLFTSCTAETPPAETTEETLAPPESTETLTDSLEESTTTPSPYTQTGFDSIVNSPSACSIEYIFFSIEDMHTYLTTGSTDLRDYKIPPDTKLEDIFPADKIRAMGYLPLTELFDIDGIEFDYCNASFQYEDGELAFRYYLDGMLILISPIKETNQQTLEYFTKQYNIDSSKISSYSSDLNLDNGYILRHSENFDIIYTVENNIKKHATFVVDGFRVTINSVARSSASTMALDYQAFLSSPNSAPFAALFSNNEQVFQSATRKVTSIKKE